jgi:hypothetical protein
MPVRAAFLLLVVKLLGVAALGAFVFDFLNVLVYSG